MADLWVDESRAGGHAARRARPRLPWIDPSELLEGGAAPFRPPHGGL